MEIMLQHYADGNILNSIYFKSLALRRSYAGNNALRGISRGSPQEEAAIEDQADRPEGGQGMAYCAHRQ